MSTAPPTTLAPTTAAPTTLATTTPPTTLAPTTTATTAAPTTAAPPLTVSAVVEYPPIYTHSAGPINIEVEILGEILNQVIDAGPIEIEVSLVGGMAIGQLLDAGPIDIVVTLESTGTLVENVRCNWVKWSKVGYLDFTIDKSNIAGERPLDWKGCVYRVLKLDKSVVVYGENGVSLLVPSGVTYRLQTIHRIGIVHKTAVVGTEYEHYFIDQTDRLYKLSPEGLKLLDYQEFLTLMTNPVMTMDVETGLIYICDDTYGYVYSTKSNSFGSGPVNVTGVGSQSGIFYVVSPDDIEVPKLHICTDIYDLGERKPKTIQTVEVGTDLTDRLQVMVETRINNKDAFNETAWKLVNPSGIAYVPCYGTEFRFHVRSFIYEYLELDYLRITGVMHGYSYLDEVSG